MNMILNRRIPDGLLYVLFIWSITLVVTTAAPPKPGVDLSRFPEQKLGPPENLRDGQSLRDKTLIMKMINLLERETISKQMPKKNQALQLVSNNRRRKKRKLDTEVLLKDSGVKWTLPINYLLDVNYTETMREAVRVGIRHWEEETCIAFTNNANTTGKSLSFINGSGCYSFVGNDPTKTVEQIISIGEPCLRKGTVAHEIGHALGFWHEHAREDRDDYVTIVTENIEFGNEYNFAKKTWGQINNLGILYDIGSVMHYGGQSFSKTNTVTMQSKNPLLQNTMGQREELSFHDVKLANLAYCNDSCNATSLLGTCLHDGYQDPKNCSRCRCPQGLSGDNCEKVAPSNDECGGTIQLRVDSLEVIRSPGYPNTYIEGLKCYWLIKSPNGTAIHMKFIKPYMDSGYCDSDNPYQPCQDFVEVRFTDNLGVTGGRFCCDDSVQELSLQQPIITHSNHALVLFKSYAPGNVGFSLQVTIDSCGGCHNNVTDNQVVCLRTVVKVCFQQWTTLVKYSTCSWWNPSGCYSGYKEQVAERESRCYSEEPYCCQGYKLTEDKHSCIKDTDVPSTLEPSVASTTNASNTTIVGGNNTVADQGDITTWSDWTNWSNCSVSCGGLCGVQTRSRNCSDVPSCNGDSVQSQTQSCGAAIPCGTKSIVKTCSVDKIEAFPCFIGTCYKPPVTKYYTQTINCCCGYKIVNNVCVVGLPDGV